MWESGHDAVDRPWRSTLLTSSPGLVHAFTGSDANLSASQGPDADRALECRRMVCARVGLDSARLTFGRQVHGSEIAIVGDGPAECGFAAPGGRIPHVDGLITDLPGVPLLGLSADCPIVLAYDPGNGRRRSPVVGMVHAGWRGAAGGIVPRLVDLMHTRFDCDIGRMQAAITPSAGPCCYEIRDDVIRVIGARNGDAAAYIQRRDARTYLDLWTLLGAQLAGCGIGPAAQDIAHRCSICDGRFFSFRRDGAATGHAGLIAGIQSR